MSPRTLLRSLLATDRSPPAHRPRRFAVEQLEAREVPAALSISDGNATEGSPQFTSLGAVVSHDNYSGLNRTTATAWGPDGNLYVGSQSANQILRFDGQTGTLLGTFIVVNSPAVEGIVFRPDGKLYVLSRDTAQVQRYDPATGAIQDVFIPSGSGGLSGAKGMTVGPDGNWYISSADTNQILRYSGATGAFLGVFVTAGSGGLSQPRYPTFGPDGNLYVSNSGAGGTGTSVLRYNGQTGAFMNAFVAPGAGGLLFPAGLLFSGGSLYVSSQNTSEVLRFDAQTGAFLDKVATAGSGGLDRPCDLLLDSSGNLLVSSAAEVLRYGPSSQAPFTIRLDAASDSPVTVAYSTADGSATAGTDYTATSGTITFAPGEITRTILVASVDDSVSEPNEMFAVNLSNPVGATITRGQATGTITDNDYTKFYVADDGSSDRTYRYGVPGNSLATTSLAAGNTTPRGVATTAAGNKVWVADASGAVYVYAAGGGLLGSWVASGLPSGASVEGVATNGTDIWVLVNTTSKDKVFKYNGAAGRLAGSQTPASSFKLATADTTPKDIVTDGTSFWVVDANKSVYKYTLAGSSLGSWAIDAANAHPTGLTINPASVSDIWIVDNVTLKVYQYTAAAGRTSGSQSAAATFALNPADTNPQGIADPPPAGGAPAATVAWPAADPVFGPAATASAATHVPLARPATTAQPDIQPGAAPAAALNLPGAGRLPTVAFDLAPIDVDTLRPKGRRY